MARPWYGNGPLTEEDSARGDRAWGIVAPTEAPLGEGWLKPRALREGDQQTLLSAYRHAVRRAKAAGNEGAAMGLAMARDQMAGIAGSGSAPGVSGGSGTSTPR